MYMHDWPMPTKYYVHADISGSIVCAFAAADGQCGLAKIYELVGLVDTCSLHVLQRAVLFSIGLAGATSKRISPHSTVGTLAVKSVPNAYADPRPQGPASDRSRGVQMEEDAAREVFEGSHDLGILHYLKPVRTQGERRFPPAAGREFPGRFVQRLGERLCPPRVDAGQRRRRPRRWRCAHKRAELSLALVLCELHPAGPCRYGAGGEGFAAAED